MVSPPDLVRQVLPGDSPAMTNIHATTVVLGDRGIVISGQSGAGKTQLALDLICHAQARGMFARLVADDQTFVTGINGRLIASVPPAIAGLVEVRGVGPVGIPWIARAAVDLLVRLVGDNVAERMPEPRLDTLLGCELPVLELGMEDRQAALSAILARLSAAPFAPP